MKLHQIFLIPLQFFLATGFEFLYIITALVFSAPSELISPIFGPGFNLICPKADWHMFSTCVWVCLPLTYLFTFLSAWVEQAYSFRIFSSAESLFHASAQLSSLTTPPRLSEISKKNWRVKGQPFITSHLWYKIMLKVP